MTCWPGTVLSPGNRRKGCRAGWWLVLGGWLALGPAWGFDHSHAAFTRVLAGSVQEGRVNYAALKARPAGLEEYLKSLSRVPRGEFDTWSQSQQLAFLCNLYNAATLRLILDHYPVSSIKKIGSLFKGPWKQPVVRVFGSTLTLDELEHGQLRAKYTEPRIHFALVCAAKSCPPLRSEAFEAARLEDQLNEQGRIFLGTASKNRLDRASQTLWLSPIFDWYAGDFTAGGRTLGGFVAGFLPPTDAQMLRAGRFKIKYTDYDWSLNDRTPD